MADFLPEDNITDHGRMGIFEKILMWLFLLCDWIYSK